MLVFFGFCLAAALLPVVLTETLPLYDYPNHLARAYIILNLDHSEILRRYYALEWAPLPNLAMDLVVPLFGRVVAVETAGKIFIALSFFAISGGTVALHYALHKRVSFYPLLAFLFLYNEMFVFGFLNYYFSVGLYLVVFAAWILLRDRGYGLRLLVFSALSTLVYLSHLYGIGLYAISVFGFELGQYWKARKAGARYDRNHLIVVLGQFAVSGVLFLFFSQTSGQAKASSFGDVLNLWHYWGKIGLLMNVAESYNDLLDSITVTGLLAGLAIGLVTRRIVMSREMDIPLIFLALVYMLMPKTLFSSWAADNKFPMALVFSLIAATDWRIQSARWRVVLAAGVLCLFLARTGVVLAHWHEYDRRYDEFLAAFDTLPRGSALTFAAAYRGSPDVLRRPSFHHIAGLAVIRREAFVATLFALPGVQPLRYTPAYDGVVQDYSRKTGDFGWAFQVDYMSKEDLLTRKPFDEQLLRHFDYLMVVNREDFPLPLPDNLTPAFRGRDFQMFRIDHGYGPAQSPSRDREPR